jgi:hypothetical protein
MRHRKHPHRLTTFIWGNGVVEKPHVWGLFKNVQMQGAQKTEPRGVYRYTLNGAVCSAIQQIIFFQQTRNWYFLHVIHRGALASRMRLLIDQKKR